MRLINTESKWFKTVLWIAFYAFTFQIIVPSVHAINLLSNEGATDYASRIPFFAHTRTGVSKKNAQKAIAKQIRVSKTNQSKMAGGPGGQAESGGFSITSTDGMVDKFSGDFSYSIPLGDVEGFPLVLKYNSNVTMQSEASWVGLGWNLNAGDVAREMRGLPDEFNGDQTIVRTMSKNPETTNGWKAGGYYEYKSKFKGKKIAGVNLEFGLKANVTAIVGRYENTYLGKGTTLDLSLSGGISGKKTDKLVVSLGPSFGLNYDSKRGIGTNKSFGLSAVYGDGMELGGGLTFGNSFNSRGGMQQKMRGLNLNVAFNFGKQSNAEFGYSSSSSVPYGTNSIMPRVMLNSYGESHSYQTKLFMGFQKEPFGSKHIFGLLAENYDYRNDIKLTDNNKLSQKAIGYFHNSKRKNYASSIDEDPVLMDYNRSNDFGTSENLKNLPMSTQTYDLFFVNSMAMNASFRGRRQDIGTYYESDRSSEVKGPGNQINLGVMKYPVTTFGITVGYERTTSESNFFSGNQKDALGNNVFVFTDESKGTSFDNAVYFKAMGEMTPENTAKLTSLGGTDPTRLEFKLGSNKKNIDLTNNLMSSNNTPLTTIIANDLNKKEDLVRANYFRPYTASEYVANEKKYQNYSAFKENSFGWPMYKEAVVVDRLNPLQKVGGMTSNGPEAPNLITAIETVSTDGSRCLFGIPAFNLASSETSFCADGLAYNSGLTTFSANDASPYTTRGTKYYDRTDVPAYAPTFLLTEMVSSDYKDRFKDGPTLDDVGSYYRFNYTRIHTGYKWKFPMGENTAVMSQGNLGTSLDDMANFSSGMKEIWYMHSVESKNFIAEFVLENREDGFGVTESGKIDPNLGLRKLAKIVIYNRAERMKVTDAVVMPVQTIEFEYSYDLCQNDPSNKNTGSDKSKSGKLTLTKIRSYSGNSRENGVYTYEFKYDLLNNNPDFSYQNMDVWGNFKTNDSEMSNDLFPYASQNKVNADQAAKGWKLTQIQTPLHGTIDIQYEADTYSTVQNKKAMQHVNIFRMTNLVEFFKINAGAIWDGTSNVSTNLSRNFTNATDVQNVFSSWNSNDFGKFNKTFMSNNSGNDSPYKTNYGYINFDLFPNNVIIFPLVNVPDATMDKNSADKFVKDNYFIDSESGDVISDLYFKLNVDASDDGSVKESMPVFGRVMPDMSKVFDGKLPVSDDLKATGVMPLVNGKYKYGYVVIEPAQIGESGKKGEDLSEFSNKSDAVQMNSLQKAAMEYIRRNLQDKVYGSCVTCNGKAAIDLAVTIGGKDVNLALYKKRWAQRFNPTKTTVRTYVSTGVKFGGNGRVKSITYGDLWNDISQTTLPDMEYNSSYTWNYTYLDGNASFEPKQGIDENPLYYWSSYKNVHKKYPDESNFTPTPLAIDLFPNASVGYGRVEVVFNSAKNRGKLISEFHTSKGENAFKEIAGNVEVVHTDKPTNMVAGTSTDLYGMSQGYVIRTNDFFGKPKRSMIEDGVGNLISRTTYNYKDLSKSIPMLNREGALSYENVAQQIDIHADSRYVKQKFKFFTVGLDLEIRFSIQPPPLPPLFKGIYPTPIVGLPSTRKMEFYTHTLIKHINQSAIVESIETEYLNSVNMASNLVYDKFSGNVIVSSLNDEYDDKLYSVNYPAHWYYKELRERNYVESTSGIITVNSNLHITTNPTSEFLTQGDVVKFAPFTNMNQSFAAFPYVYIGKHNPWGENSTLFLLSSYSSDINNIFDYRCGLNASSQLIPAGNYAVSIFKSNRDNRLDDVMQTVVTKLNPFVYASTDPKKLVSFTFPTKEIIESSAVTYKDRNSYPGWERYLFHSEYLGLNVNPYSDGFRGELIVDGAFEWQSPRVQDQHFMKTRFDGAYTSYFPFYALVGTKWKKINETNHPNYLASDLFRNWRKMGEITLFNQFGTALESRDQINVFSTSLYGYSSDLELAPVATAVNARYQQIAFDGFEDYSYYKGGTFGPINLPMKSKTHFDFKNMIDPTKGVYVDYLERHSGLSCLRLDKSASVEVNKRVGQNCIPGEALDDLSVNYVKVTDCMQIKPFEPTPGTYIISAWVKGETGIGAKSEPTVLANIEYVADFQYSSPVTFKPQGPIIDGWQRIEGSFVITASTTDIAIRLVNASGARVYFDDLRIHPELAQMTTIVYDPKTLLPLATHDAYNYTTFYNYDENLTPVRTRVETIEGIKTVSEMEAGGYRRQK